MIDVLFDNLDAWRHLPAYQLEKRADVFFAAYLPHFIQSKYKREVQAIIPEFPIRIGSIRTDLQELNKSFKVDYVLRIKAEPKVVFVELKTDDQSRREGQDQYLEQARTATMPKLAEGLLKIYEATDSKPKYDHLINLAVKAGFLNPDHSVNHSIFSIDILYLQPTNQRKSANVVDFLEFAKFVEQSKDALSQRFARSLRQWAQGKPGEVTGAA